MEVRGERENKERVATTREDDKTMPFLQQSSAYEKTLKKTQQSDTKTEVAETIGCWKMARMFQG